MAFTDEGKEPSGQSVLAEAMEHGWEWFDHPEDATEMARYRRRHEERGKRLAQVAAQLWQGEAFRELVDWLLDVSLRRSTFVAKLGLPMDQAYGYGCFREGQNAMVMVLMKLIAEGQKVKPPAPRDTGG